MDTKKYYESRDFNTKFVRIDSFYIASKIKGGANMYDSREDTKAHINLVGDTISKLIVELWRRAKDHDKSKLEEPEKPIFDKYTPKLAGTTYGSEEYKEYLSEMNIALEHHYENNRHHPEYYINGIVDMNLIDLLEMISDWNAATMRYDDGDIMKSIDINQKRFGYSDELKQILINTVVDYFGVKDME